ncbi:MAG: hypothetical protein ACX93T_03160 [Bacteroidota bacterium]
MNNEAAISLKDVSVTMPRLIQEGKAKNYLTQAVKLPINALD